MIKANFNTYASYVTDSLYQWDINQVLSVTGLNLTVAPEVHFSNANTDRAIVRQTDMIDHVVRVVIPNSLLQEPFTIHAHVGIYEGATFRVIERIEIPVVARKRPADYAITDADDEIYSFKALENALRNKADAAVVTARIDNIIAHNNDTDGNTELLDVRTGFDGTVFASAGEAVRRATDRLLKITPTWVSGYIRYINGSVADFTVYNSTDFLPVNSRIADRLVIYTFAGVDDSGVAFYDRNKLYISGANIGQSDNTASTYYVDIPENACYFRYTCLTAHVSKSYVLIDTNEVNMCSVVNSIGEDNAVGRYAAWENGYYLYKLGYKAAFTGNSDFMYTELNVNEGEIYHIKGYAADDTRLYAMIDGNGNAVGIYPAENSSLTLYDTTVTIPAGVRMLRVGGYQVKTLIEIVNYDEVIYRLLHRGENAEIIDYSLACENVLCIGDSLTAGGTYLNVSGGIRQTFPHYLERMLNANVTNAGVGGYSASDWYIAHGTEYDYTQFDTFVVWFGTNYGCNSMPTDSEIRAFVPSNTANASEVNQALYFIRIINDILTANPDAFIIVCNVFASKSNVNINNEVIAQIAAKYNLHLIDMSDIGASDRPDLHGDTNNPHFAKAGNLLIANRIIAGINKVFNDNPRLCEFGITE